MAAFESRIDSAAQFAAVNRVLLLRAASGVGPDIALGSTSVPLAYPFFFPPAFRIAHHPDKAESSS